MSNTSFKKSLYAVPYSHTKQKGTIFIFRLSGCMRFVHLPEFYVTRKHNVSEVRSISVFQ
jgi:uncharacterized protein (DUF1499 family)